MLIPRMLSVLRCIGCIWYYDASEATMYWMFRNVIMRSLSFNLISICPDQINSHYWLLQYPSSKIWSLSSRFRSQEHDLCLNGKKNKNGNFRLWCLLRRNADWFIIFKEAIKFGKFQIVLDNFLFFIYIAVVISFLKLYTWPSHPISLFLLGIVSTWMSVMCVSERMNDITKLLHTLIGRSFTYYSIPTEFRGQFLELVWNKHPLWTWSFRLLYFSRCVLVTKGGFSGIFNA